MGTRVEGCWGEVDGRGLFCKAGFIGLIAVSSTLSGSSLIESTYILQNDTRVEAVSQVFTDVPHESV